jgi:Protein of unknown function (DUF3309)
MNRRAAWAAKTINAVVNAETELDHVAWAHPHIVLVIFLLGGFSGRLGGYGYGYRHGGVGVIGLILIILLVLILLGRL